MTKVWTALVVKSGMKYKEPPKQFDVLVTHATTEEAAIHNIAVYVWPVRSGWIKGKSICQIVKIFQVSTPDTGLTHSCQNLVPNVEKAKSAPSAKIIQKRRRRRRRIPSE